MTSSRMNIQGVLRRAQQVLDTVTTPPDKPSANGRTRVRIRTPIDPTWNSLIGDIITQLNYALLDAKGNDEPIDRIQDYITTMTIIGAAIKKKGPSIRHKSATTTTRRRRGLGSIPEAPERNQEESENDHQILYPIQEEIQKQIDAIQNKPVQAYLRSIQDPHEQRQDLDLFLSIVNGTYTDDTERSEAFDQFYEARGISPSSR